MEERNTWESVREALPSWKLLCSGAVGAATFPAVLAATQVAVFKPLRVSYKPGLTSSLAGLASVAVASFGASLAALKTISLVQQYLPEPGKRFSITYRHLFLSTVGGVLVFRALGGRFERVLPSNLMRPGAFAADWIPALNEAEYATLREREAVQTLGRQHGCHSCGTRGWGRGGGGAGEKFVADHQPPSKLLGIHQNTPSTPNPLAQRFYPQCKNCSAIQGGLLAGKDASAAATHAKAIRTHGASLRPYHTFLPVPFLTVYLFNTWSEPTKKISPSALNSQVKAEVLNSSSETQAASKVAKEATGVVMESSKVVSRSGEREGKKAALGVWRRMDVDGPLGFPLLILWQEVVRFLDSFRNPLASFHLTLWAFTIVAALGTI